MNINEIIMYFILGSFVIAKGSDDQFYRAQIISKCDLNFEVYYPDYGVKEKISSCNVFSHENSKGK